MSVIWLDLNVGGSGVEEGVQSAGAGGEGWSIQTERWQ
jgi:hypothetical protein